MGSDEASALVARNWAATGLVPWRRIMPLGWLVIEDIFTVLVLVLVPALAGQREQRADNAFLSVGIAVGKIILLAAITFFVGKRWLPRFLGWVAATRSRELFTLSVLAVALGIAVGSATLFGASMALGAFLAGMIVNQSAYSHRAPNNNREVS
jgi:CPA2 family monovalent cation:H+ antiporter-2